MAKKKKPKPQPVHIKTPRQRLRARSSGMRFNLLGSTVQDKDGNYVAYNERTGEYSEGSAPQPKAKKIPTRKSQTPYKPNKV